MQRVYLIPGFFGFANLGDLQYFGHAKRFIDRRFVELGVPGCVHAVASAPTASLRQRAKLLLDAIVATSGDDDDLHLVGHSSGGLDARLLATADARLPGDATAEPWASRVRSVVSVATPHHGTPSAEVFASLSGKQLLRMLSLATAFVVRYGSLPVGIAIKLAGLVRSAGDAAREPQITDELFGSLLAEFSADRRDAVGRFFGDVATDQGLLSQITPDGMDLFAAAAPDRPGVRYGSVVAQAREPGVRATLDAGLRPHAQAMNAVYTWCWTLASRMPPERLSPLSADQVDALTRAYGEVPTAAGNDGMVPTRSQVHGTLIRAVIADHLDVIGHFADPEAVPPHYDWLSSGSQFRRAQFEATWTDVTHFLLGRPPLGPA